MMHINDAVTLQPYQGDHYETPASAALPVSSFFPSISFYVRMCAILKRAADVAKSGNYTSDEWIASSVAIRDALEKCGVTLAVEGLGNVASLNEPCVFVANHMSTLETFILPGLIRPFLPVTFVVKESLMRYPFFRHVMKSRDPIVVERKEPRADFAAVMEGGVASLTKGISVIIFPQSTRRPVMDKRHFNSMGVKLARKAGARIVPVALRTDAWGMGGLFGMLRDHGPIRPHIPVRFRFAPPFAVTGNGKAEHDRVYSFIETSLAGWGIEPVKTASSLAIEM